MITAGALLPAVSLPSASTGAMVDLRSGRGPRVLVAVHSAACDACRRYVRAAVAGGDRLVEWVRFIAIQCAECEGPEGEWRTV